MEEIKDTNTNKAVTTKKPTKAEIENKKLLKDMKLMKEQMETMMSKRKELEDVADKEKKSVELLKEELEKATEKIMEKEDEIIVLNKDFNVDKPKKGTIPKELDIVIKSNIDGGFIYSDNKGKTNVYIKLSEMFEEDILSFEELRAFNNGSDWLKSGQIAIEDVESDEYDLKDIISGLRLHKLYDNEKSISPNEIEKMFTDEINAKRFDEILLNSDHMADAIVQVALAKIKNGTFNDSIKISYLKQRTLNPALFK